MIIIGLGANLPSPAGPPERTLRAALAKLDSEGIRVISCSRFFASEPVPRSDQPLFVNAVAMLATHLTADAVLARLHAIEAAFGRTRRERNEARPLDLDLLDYNGERRAGAAGPLLPHPRLAERAFVLAPLAELAPEWRHPVSGRSAAELLASLTAEDRAGVHPLPLDQG
ncbi:MAG: 2-amino-4-hydroxy-6-hydroxymethyldihydropteridine diphosphokinase [Gemmatimonas sp.]